MCTNMPHESVMTIDKADNGYMITHCDGNYSKTYSHGGSTMEATAEKEEKCEHKMYVAKNLKEAIVIVKSCLEENGGKVEEVKTKPIAEEVY